MPRPLLCMRSQNSFRPAALLLRSLEGKLNRGRQTSVVTFSLHGARVPCQSWQKAATSWKTTVPPRFFISLLSLLFLISLLPSFPLRHSRIPFLFSKRNRIIYIVALRVFFGFLAIHRGRCKRSRAANRLFLFLSRRSVSFQTEFYDWIRFRIFCPRFTRPFNFTDWLLRLINLYWVVVCIFFFFKKVRGFLYP